ncbi:hypothetical protein [Vibrio sp. 10N.239.312.D08]|uniref:hypothetical protein n=1 Tax=Vibrio sp. 10N.239.312.D08 TaxID=3229978 RepID=UPI003552A028
MMNFNKKIKSALLLPTLTISSLGVMVEAKQVSKDMFDSSFEYMIYSDGYHDEKSDTSYAAQCHSNEKASEMMAVSKLSKFLSGSTITAEESTSHNSTYSQNITSKTKSFRPDYMVVANDNFDGYYCTLVATKD